MAASTFKGRVVHTLIKNDIALHVAHTNADRADPGVSDALAGALDLRVVRPLVPDTTDPKGRRGLGRVCELDHPMTVRALAARAAERLPATVQGIRVAGDPEAPVRTIAVSGGSGDSLFDEVRAAGVDAFLTADLRHHPASEFAAASTRSPLALLDAAHWATEWPWCQLAATQLERDLRPARVGPARPRLADGHRPLDRPRGVRHRPARERLARPLRLAHPWSPN